MLQSLETTKLCLHVLLLVGYITTALPLLVYYFKNKHQFYMQPRGPRLLLLYGTHNIILVVCFVTDLQWGVLPCVVTQILGFLFPVALMIPTIMRGLKVIVLYEGLWHYLPYLRFRVVMPFLVALYTGLAVIGYFTASGLSSHRPDIGFCVMFYHWLYFLIVIGVLMMVMGFVWTHIRRVNDSFHVSSEVIGHIVIFAVFFGAYTVCVLLVYFNSLDLESITQVVRPQYYIILVAAAGFYLSFIMPLRHNFYRAAHDLSMSDEHDESEVSSISTTSPLSENVLPSAITRHLSNAELAAYMTLSVAEMMREKVTRDALFHAAKTALCPEVVHFMSSVQDYHDRCDAEQDECPMESEFVAAVSNKECEGPAEDVFGGRPSVAGRRSSLEICNHDHNRATTTHSVASSGNSRSRSGAMLGRLLSTGIASLLPAVLDPSSDRGAISKAVASQYSHYCSIVEMYIEEYAVEQVNVSSVARKRCCELLLCEDFLAAPIAVRREVFDVAVAEVHAMVKCNLHMDIRKYLKGQVIAA